MTRKSRKSFTQTVEDFESASTWLSDEDQPAVTTLYALAEELDGDGPLVPALVAQFGLTYRSLLKRAPVGDAPEVDPLEEALRRAG